MPKTTIYHIKLLLVYLIDLLYRVFKFCKFLWSGKHEFERICESDDDIYEKTFQMDRWLQKTRSSQICDFLQQHFEDTGGVRQRDSQLKRCINVILIEFQQDENLTKDRSKQPRSRVKKRRSNEHQTHRPRFEHLEDGDVSLATALKTTSLDFVRAIKKAKGVETIPRATEECLREILYRIVCYKANFMLLERLATTRYNAEFKSHTDKLLSFWNHLIEADGDMENEDKKAFPRELAAKIKDSSDIVSSRWSHVGFQGEDPGTDFRGMGLLGLLQLEYLSRRPRKLARDLLKRSLNEAHSYPLAIVGINITYNLYNLFKHGSLKHFYYDNGNCLFRGKNRDLNLLETLNEIYIELFLRFDCFWHESKPENIFAFRELMEKFVNIVKMDLCNRNFSFKFIY